MNLNNQNFFSRDSICSEILDNQDDLKDLLSENNYLKEQIEHLKKTQENEKFEYENKIKNYEREITKLKSSLHSANEMIEVYKVIDKQNENSEIKDIVQKLKVKNNELEQINLLLKRENADVVSELENLKLKVKALNANKNLNNCTKGEAEVKENENVNYLNSNKNFNSICSTNQGSSFNVNLNNQFSNETINFNGKTDNGNNNKANICASQPNLSFENKDNMENEENSRKNNHTKTNENEQAVNECENEMDESASIASDISFSSKNTNQLKEIFVKIKREKNRIYDNAVELMTENEIEIKTLKNENEDMKFALYKYEEDFTRIKTFLKERHNINIDENELLFNIEEKSYENLETYNSNYQTEKRNLHINTENSIRKDIKAIENNYSNLRIDDGNRNLDHNRDAFKEYTSNNENIKNTDENNGFNNVHFELKGVSENTSPYKKVKFEDERYLSSDKYSNSFEQEKNDLRNFIESLETKLFETSKNYEEKISRLKQDLENIELEKNQYQQELENIQSNKKNLVEDIEFYSVTVRSLQDQKEKLEDNLKNKIDYLIADNKSLEQTIMKSQDQVLLLEKENKEIKEKEGKRFTELKENFAKEKDAFDAKFKELTNRYFECNKEKESLKKDNENLKQLLERKKVEIDELLEKKLRAKEKKESEINSINEKYRILIEKQEAGYNTRINKYQEKIKGLYSIIEKNIEKINSLTKEFNSDSYKRSKSSILNKEQISKIKWNKNMLNANINDQKVNFNDLNDFDLLLSSGQINESPMEYENKHLSDYASNEILNKEITTNEEIKTKCDNDNSDVKNNINNNNKETNPSPFNDQKSNETSIKSKEYDLSTSQIENKINFMDPENRKDNDFIDLYGFDPKKRHNSYLKSLNSINFHSEISSNSVVNTFLNNECANNVPLAFALEEENVNQNKIKPEIPDNLNNNKRKSKINFLKRRSSINLVKKLSRENIKKRLKSRVSKQCGELISNVNKGIDQGDKCENFKEDIKEKFNFMLIKKTQEKEINELKSKIAEYEYKIKKLEEEAQNIDSIIILKDLKEKTMLLTQENKNLKDEIQILKTDLETLEENKNQYIQKLKKDIEKAEDTAAKAKFSMGQLNFEKDSEVLKYRNYCKKLRITIKTLEENNRIMAENINNLNSRKILNKNA